MALAKPLYPSACISGFCDSREVSRVVPVLGSPEIKKKSLLRPIRYRDLDSLSGGQGFVPINVI